MKWTSVVGLIVVLLLSCKDNPVTPTEIAEVEFYVGTTNTYAWSGETKDSLGTLLLSYTDTIVTRVAAIGDTIGGESGLIRMEAYSTARYAGVERVWYKPLNNTLQEVAYSNPSGVPVILPKRVGMTAALQAGLNGVYFFVPRVIRIELREVQKADSIQFRIDKRIVYSYPLKKGTSWVSFQDPFLQTREVVSVENLNINSTSYLVAKIKTELPEVIPDIEFFDYVAQEGLIQRTIYHPKLSLASQEDPEGIIGWVSITERLSLISSNAN